MNIQRVLALLLMFSLRVFAQQGRCAYRARNRSCRRWFSKGRRRHTQKEQGSNRNLDVADHEPCKRKPPSSQGGLHSLQFDCGTCVPVRVRQSRTERSKKRNSGSNSLMPSC
jgi:hypothetical protein